MAQNITNMTHTKHVDIRYKHVNEYVKDEVVKKFLLNLLKVTVTFSQKA